MNDDDLEMIARNIDTAGPEDWNMVLRLIEEVRRLRAELADARALAAELMRQEQE